MAVRCFRHQASGQIRMFGTGSSRVLAGLFGIFYFPFKGAWMTSFAILLVAMVAGVVFAPLLFLVWLGMVITTPDLLTKSYLARGYVEVDKHGVVISSPTKLDGIMAAQVRSVMPDSRSMQAQDRADKWKILTEYDADIATAAKRVSALGAAAEQEFCDAYLAVNDRAQINAIADKVIAKYRQLQPA